MFDEVRFPDDISYGSRGGPKFNTTVLTLASGFEKRNINWSQVRCEFDVSHGIKTIEQMDALLAFFYARQGMARGFRYKDWADYTAQNQTIAVGDGVTTVFQLRKNYPSGPNTYSRIISKPVVGTVFGVKITGVNPVTQLPQSDTLDESKGQYTVDYTTGKITIAVDPFVDWLAAGPGNPTPKIPQRRPIAVGRKVEVVSFEFDVPVRFGTDVMNISQDFWMTESWESIPLVEVRVR